MEKKQVGQIWVNKEFKMLLKKKALESDCSILKLTEQLARDDDFRNLRAKKHDWRF